MLGELGLGEHGIFDRAPLDAARGRRVARSLGLRLLARRPLLLVPMHRLNRLRCERQQRCPRRLGRRRPSTTALSRPAP
eukprot:2520595-Prymnesium_polylepis.1